LTKTNVSWPHSFKALEPKVSHMGDLVQVEMSFITMPTKGGKQKLKAILRTIALINDTFAKVRTNGY